MTKTAFGDDDQFIYRVQFMFQSVSHHANFILLVVFGRIQVPGIEPETFSVLD